MSNDFGWFEKWFGALIDNVGVVLKGKSDEVGLAVLAMFAGGHVLLEDFPGTGKTTLAKALAASMKGSWNRVQFTPDLLPSDVTGGMIFDQKNHEFEFHAGPIFANIVLADEINRASPKTQSALLQVMEEAQVTVDGSTFDVPKPFMVIATQNPIEQEGTYRLPEAQLDRFMLKLSLGYPDHDAEVEMLRSVGDGRKASDIAEILAMEDLREMIQAVQSVHIEDSIRSYIVRLCAHTRDREAMPELRLGVSPRGAVALMQISKAMAAARGRGYVNVDDVQNIAPYVMAHRMLLTPEAELRRVSTEEQVARAIESVAVPELTRA